MTTMTLVAREAPRDRLEQVGLASLIGMVAAAQLSIAVAQILLAIAALCWFAAHVARRERLEAPRFFWPLLAYAAWTLVSAAASPDSRASFIDSKQLVLFLIVPMVYQFARGSRARASLAEVTVAVVSRMRTSGRSAAIASITGSAALVSPTLAA